MSVWEVVYTEQAERDLRGIYEYIALSLFAPETAKKQAKRIMEAVAKLDQTPLRHPLYERGSWASRGLRFLPIDRYLAFYQALVEGQTVVVVRIMYAGRDVEEQLRRTETDVAEGRQTVRKALIRCRDVPRHVRGRAKRASLQGLCYQHEAAMFSRSLTEESDMTLSRGGSAALTIEGYAHLQNRHRDT